MAPDPYPKSSRAPSSYRDVELGHPLASRPSGYDDDRDDSGRAGGDGGPADWEHQEQHALLRQQDDTLDQLHGSLGTIGGQARLMGQEVGEQNGMLDELDTHVSSTQDKLARATRKINAFIRRSEEKGSGWCIVVLMVVLCILLVAVILV